MPCNSLANEVPLAGAGVPSCADATGRGRAEAKLVTTTMRRGPRLLAYLLLWCVTLAVVAGAGWGLKLQHEAAVGELLERHHFVQDLGWQAIRRQTGNNVRDSLDRYVLNDDVLAVLRAAQAPEQRAPARHALEQRLAGVSEQLRDRGVDFLQFHLPDGSSLLRLHAPELLEDAPDTRASLPMVRQQRQPVSGFEVGRTAFAYRNVFPIVDEHDQYLASVELSVHYRRLVADLEAMWTDRYLEVVVSRDHVRSAMGEAEQGLFATWAGSPRFMLGPGASPTPPAGAATFNPPSAALATTAGLRERVESGIRDAFRLSRGGHDFAVLQTPLLDSADRSVGLLMTYVPEPALAKLDAGYRLNAGVSFAVILMLGLVSHWLLRLIAGNAGERRRLGLITRSLGQGLYVLDGKGVITEVNPRACSLLGYSEGELVGRKAAEVFHGGGEGEHAGAEAVLAATARGERYVGEQRFRCKDGSVLEVALTSVPLQDEAGSVTLFEDITRQKAQEGQLKRSAHFDALTGLANRVLLADRLALAMARANRSGTRLALAFIDLDGFKAVNDNHGHEVGDRLLVRLGQRMQAVVRDTDTVARLGGDEFAVVLSGLSDSVSFAPLLERLLHVLAQPEVVDDQVLQVSASIGVSLYPQSEDIDADQLLRQADQAMYEAKLAGKGRYRVFDLDQHVDLRGRNQHIERLQQAIDRSELRLYYQPCVNLRTGALEGLEALIRWQHPEKGLLAPGEFLPMIDRHELEMRIGRWVLRNALQQIDYWQRKGLKTTVSVNIAGGHLQHSGFAEELARFLAAWPNVAPSQLQLEVVESSALENLEQVCRVVDACSALGVRVSLDDFGTGYSSLAYLKRLPVHGLKLDRGFVRDMLHDPEDLTIVEGVLNLARAFDLQAVAEGVESIEHGRMLRQLGCEFAQGYAIARPMPPSGLLQWLKAWSLPDEWLQVTPVYGEAREILYGLAEHRGWRLALHAHLNDPDAAPSPSGSSRLRSYRRLEAGLETWGEPAMRRELASAYERVHQLAEDLIGTRRQGDRHAALVRWGELEQASLRLERILEEMSAAAMRPGRRRL